MALGARAGAVVRMVLRQGVALAVFGVAVGSALNWGVGRVVLAIFGVGSNPGGQCQPARARTERRQPDRHPGGDAILWGRGVYAADPRRAGGDDCGGLHSRAPRRARGSECRAEGRINARILIGAGLRRRSPASRRSLLFLQRTFQPPPLDVGRLCSIYLELRYEFGGLVPTCRGLIWFLALSLSVFSSAQGVSITEYPLASGSVPWGITAGPDGALWFVDEAGNSVDRITTAGVVTAYPIPTSEAGAVGIAKGPDGALWFTEFSANQIGRITTAGSITEYPVTTLSASPASIAAGPDGALWFAEFSASQIGRITTAGAISEYPVPTSSSAPLGLIAGQDGALWFTENVANQIGRITTSGAVVEYRIPTSSSMPYGIAAGPDGALWFAESGAGKIGRITTADRSPSTQLQRLIALQLSSRPARTVRSGLRNMAPTRSAGLRPPA